MSQTEGSNILSQKYFFVTVLYIVAAAAAALSKSTATQTTLELVQILFRHGDRTPLNIFPTDQHASYWTQGLGQLTNIGKRQQFHLGRYVRQRYGGFLNETYNREEVVVRSTDVDRTLMSAQSHLAGLYPPKGDQIWNRSIAWQPIPVHTIPEPIDLLLNVACDTCAKYNEAYDDVMKLPEVQKVLQENRGFFEMLTKETGMTINNFDTAGKIYDTIFIETDYNLSIPKWASDNFERLRFMEASSFIYETYSTSEKRLMAGPLIKEMITNMQDKISGKTAARQLFLYSAHDTNVAAFLSALGIYNGLTPPYTCAVFVELHKLSATSHGIKFFFRNTTDGDPYELTIPGCSSPCLVEQFISLTKPIIPDDIGQECRAGPSPGVFASLPWTVAVLTSSLTIAFLAVIVIGIVFWRKNRGMRNYGYSMVQEQ